MTNSARSSIVAVDRDLSDSTPKTPRIGGGKCNKTQPVLSEAAMRRFLSDLTSRPSVGCGR